MVAVKADGTQTSVVTTEHTLATVTDPGVYINAVDLANLTGTDVVEICIYKKVRSSGTERLFFKGTYGPGAPLACPAIESIPVVSPHYMRLTLKQTVGSARDYDWAIYNT